MTNQLFFSINKHYFHTNFNLDLRRLDSWYQVAEDFHPYVDYHCLVTEAPYRKTLANKKNHYVVDQKIHWSYHLFFLFNHPTYEMLDILPDKTKRNRDFKKVYNREIKKSEILTHSTYIESSNINNLQELVKISQNYVKPRHLW